MRSLPVVLCALAAAASAQTRFIQAELVTAINTKTAAVGDPVKARVVSAVTLPNNLIVPRNAEVSGQVRAVDARSVAISFDSVEIGGKANPLSLSIRAAMAPGSAPETAAQAGSVIGMHGVTLEVDDSPKHASKFQTDAKNLKLRPGLQLMLAVPE